jgi:hypothetical protein
MTDAQDNVVSMPPTEAVRWSDGYINLLAGLGVPGRDKFMSQAYTFALLTTQELEFSYRGDWISRKAVDVPAFDMTRQWRNWQADPDQIQLLEATEKKLLLQKKVQQALIKARLYGGSAIIIGVDAGDPEEELNYDDVTKDSLKFLHVVSRNQISMGPVIYDISSRYYGQPEYYEAQNRPVDRSFQTNDPSDPNFSKTQVRLHPSRVIKLIGMDTADQLLNTVWGDSVLQAVSDAVKMCSLVSGSLATLVAEMKVDIISVPELKSILSTKEGERKMIARFQAANAAKSVINTVLIDGNEKWQRVEANLTAAPQVLSTYLQIASGAVDIPAGRFLGLPHRGLNVTGEADFRNYYDRLSSEQTVTLTPAMTALDEVLIRSALGTRPPEVWYEWNSLWQLSDGDKADIALKKAQAYQIDVNAAQLPPVALANGRANQLIEDGVYPGFEKALDDAAMEGDTIEEQNTPQPAPVGTLFGPGQHTAPFDPNAPPPVAPPGPGGMPGGPPPPQPGQTGQLPPNMRKSTFPGGKGAGDARGVVADFNPNHGPAGLFASSPGGGASKPEKSKKPDKSAEKTPEKGKAAEKPTKEPDKAKAEAAAAKEAAKAEAGKAKEATAAEKAQAKADKEADRAQDKADAAEEKAKAAEAKAAAKDAKQADKDAAKAARDEANKAKAEAAAAKEAAKAEANKTAAQAKADKQAAAAKDRADKAEAKAAAAEAKAADKDLKANQKQNAQDEAKQARAEAKAAKAEAKAADKAAKAEAKAQKAEEKAAAKDASAKDKADAKQARADAQAAKADAAKAAKEAKAAAKGDKPQKGQGQGQGQGQGKGSGGGKGGGGGKGAKGGGKAKAGPKPKKGPKPKAAPKAKAAPKPKKAKAAPKAKAPGKARGAKQAPLTSLQRRSQTGQ